MTPCEDEVREGGEANGERAERGQNPKLPQSWKPVFPSAFIISLILFYLLRLEL